MLVAKHCFPNVSICGSVHPSVDMIPVLEMQIPSNLSVAPNLCFLCNLGAPTQCSSILMKTCRAPNTVTLQLHRSSIPRLPPNRAKGVAVFESSPIRYTAVHPGDGNVQVLYS